MKGIYESLLSFSKKGRASVLATIITQAGPSPRGIGTKCLIMDDGSIVGTVGGGILEARVRKEAGKVFETGLPVRLHFSLKGRDVAQTDMLCGGDVEIFMEPVLPGDLTSIALFERLCHIEKRGGTGLLLTVIDPDRWEEGRSQKLVLEKDGRHTGHRSFPDLVDALRLRMDSLLGSRQPVILSLKGGSEKDMEIFAEPVLSNPVLFVFGAGHVSKQIVPLANLVGFEVVVIDDRPDFADSREFPHAREVHVLGFEEVMDRLSIDESSYVVIVTRGHMHDKTVLAQALRTEARYVGMIGSRRKREMIYEKLLEEGFSESDLSRVYSPIGLDIGAETPEEIAVSIVAELVKVRAKG